MCRFLCPVLLLCLLLPAMVACQPSDAQEPQTDPITATTTETEAETQIESETETEPQTEPETEPDDGRTVVEIICPIKDAVIFSGGEVVQDVTAAKANVLVSILKKILSVCVNSNKANQ